MFVDHASTPIYGQPTIRYGSYGIWGAQDIPLTVLEQTVVSRKPSFGIITGLPAVDPNSNHAWYDNLLQAGASTLPSMSISGWMETPGDRNNLPIVFRDYNYRYTFGDLIALYMEGRATQSPNALRTIDPEYFRDGYGRVFRNPRITDFSSNFVEGRPLRQTFSITFQLTEGGILGVYV